MVSVKNSENFALTKGGVQLFGQSGKDLGGHLLGIAVGQGAVIRAKLQREGHALLTLGNACSSVDVKQADAAQQLARGSGDHRFSLSNSNAFITDEGQVAGNGGVLGQGRILGCVKLKLEKLRRDLKRAIADEEYETAASLRDQIRALDAQRSKEATENE